MEETPNTFPAIRRNIRADVLAYAAIVGLISLMWALLIRAIPDGSTRDILLILSGALVAIVKDVYGYEFGSSRGSEVKTEQLGRLMGSGSKEVPGTE